MMFIDDDELRTLYKAASAEHIEAIELGLLHLEKVPDDREALKSLLREAHSLKGDSRMLGVTDVETLIHQMEEVLSAVEQGQQSLTTELCDRLYKGLDALRKIAHEAITGDPSGVNVFLTMAMLMGANTAEDPAPATVSQLSDDELALDLNWSKKTLEIEFPDPSFSDSEAFFQEVPSLDFKSVVQEVKEIDVQRSLETPEPSPESAPERGSSESVPQGDRFQIDTLRVESTKLDTLMTQADELTVTQLRIARSVEDLATLLTLWEDWSRDNSQRSAALSAQFGTAEQQALQQFHQQNDRQLAQFGQLLNQLQSTASEDAARLETVANDLEGGIRNLRMMPLSSIFNLFPRMVRDLARDQAKEINFVVEGDNLLADKKILEEIKAPLLHLLRNAVDHGIESSLDRLTMGKPQTATLRLRGTQTGNQICLEISDDGRGLNLDAIRKTALRRGLYTEAELDRMTPDRIQELIFASGFSTRTTVTEISGRGVGLDVVRANVEQLKGSIQVQSTPGQGCLFRITLNMNLAAAQALIVEVNQAPYAIPLESIETLKLVSREEIFPVEGSLTMNWEGKPISVAWLTDALELPVQSPSTTQAIHALRKTIPCVVIRQGAEHLGLMVDEFLDQQHIVIKPHSKLLKRVRNIAGATILSSGEICMVLNAQDLLKFTGGGSDVISPTRMAESEIQQTRILLVEDSIPIRTQMRRILEGAGYEVTVAVDGLDGLNKLKSGTFDAIVSDVEMPNLTGLELTSVVRELPQYDELPIILVTTLAKEEDKRKGADAGANAYLTKGDFDQNLLLSTLRRLT
jgi:two-component system, chemotaxis family, sensor kinase CheA